MTPRWTRIHAALGDQPGSLTFEQIKRAVAAKMPESDDLDWKSVLPRASAGGDHHKDEFAKDVAAMANSDGGLIVYGVSELRGSGTADKLVPVGAKEADLRSLRALAGSRIRPTVFGLDIFELGDEQDAGAVVVVHIPASEDAPHFLGDGQNGQKLGVPYRSGPETHWMRERDLERAYRERFERRVSDSEFLAASVDSLRDNLDIDRGAWITFAARPHQPSPSYLPRPDRSRITAALQEAISIGRTMNIRNRIDSISELGDAIFNPRAGLRRWVILPRVGSPDDKSQSAIVEIHHDGSVTFGCSLEGWYPSPVEGKHSVPAMLVEGFAVDAVVLLEAAAQRLGHGPSYSYRVDLVRPAEQKPYALVDTQRIGQLSINQISQPSWSRTVQRFTPVVGEHLALADSDTQKEAARRLALDVVHQFGVDELHVIG